MYVKIFFIVSKSYDSIGKYGFNPSKQLAKPYSLLIITQLYKIKKVESTIY